MWYRWSIKFALKIVELNSSAWLVFCVTVIELGTHTTRTPKLLVLADSLELHKVTAGCKNQPWHRRKSGSEGRRSNYWWPCSIIATNSSVGVCANIRQSTCLISALYVHHMYISPFTIWEAHGRAGTHSHWRTRMPFSGRRESPGADPASVSPKMSWIKWPWGGKSRCAGLNPKPG